MIYCILSFFSQFGVYNVQVRARNAVSDDVTTDNLTVIVTDKPCRYSY